AYCNPGNAQQVIAVRVDNSLQPNSRWYTGSGIYRNVRLVLANKIAIDQWGTYITTPTISSHVAIVEMQSTINNTTGMLGHGSLYTDIYDAAGKLVSKGNAWLHGAPGWPEGKSTYTYSAAINKPILWSVDAPYLYKAVTKVLVNGKVVDEYVT